MKTICDYLACTGCMACMSACAHKAIIMQADDEGFFRPHIDESICTRCDLCREICPVNKPVSPFAPSQTVYSGWSNNEEIRMLSSSGGAFTEIAKPVLNMGGVVFGCILNKDLKAVHSYIESEVDLEKLRGSKYVQSDIGQSFVNAKEFLQEGRQVLFSGTPCQIAGLRNYLRKDYPNLLTVDLICHGVPTPLMFEEYKKYISQAEGFKNLTDVRFRCKKSSWIFFNMTVNGHVEKTQTKIYEGTYYEDPYIRGFLRDYFLRPSCHQCQYNNIRRVSDFTIADWWGYKKACSEDKNFRRKGVSLVMVNTPRAATICKQLDMLLKKRTITEAIKTNKSFVTSFPASSQRREFWEYYRTHDFSKVVKKYMYPEKLSWDIALLNKYPNTDVMYLFSRIIGKVVRIFRLNK